jgi:phage repressor protein C with HTH and peptisase S24 domain
MLLTAAVSMLVMGDNFRLLGDNIAYLVAIKAASRASFADAMGISVQAVGQLIRGETKELKPSNVAKAAKHVGLTSDDLIIRNLRREQWHPQSHLRVSEPGTKYDAAPLIYFPVLSLAGAGGPGTEDGELEIVDELAFKRDWVKKKGWEPRQLFIAKVKGDSMAPYMPSGNVALVHRGDSVIRDSEDPYENVFALMDGPAFRFKKVHIAGDGSLLLKSFNYDKAQFPDERRAGQEINSVHIIGRVVWRGG